MRRRTAENPKRRAAANLIAEVQRGRILYPCAVEEGPVRRTDILDRPGVLTHAHTSVQARNSTVKQRKGFAFPAQDGLGVNLKDPERPGLYQAPELPQW